MTPLRPLLLPATLLVAVTSAGAQDTQYPNRVTPVDPPVYKCGGTYTDVNCGGRQVNSHRVSKTFDKNALPPQDRARQMARATLPSETREKCNVLEGQIRTEERRLKAKGQPATEAEEGDLAIQRVHYREMRC